MRRAISCEYWPPRSTTRTGRSSGAGCGSGTTSAAVIRRFLRDRHVVRMALAQAGAGDAHEPRALHLGGGRGADVAHRLAQPADELVDDRRQRALVRDPALDPLGHEVARVLHIALEVAVLREPARLHRAERPHPAVLLEALALVHDHVAGRLIRAREHRSE